MPLAESERGVTNPAGDLVAQAEQIVLGAMMLSPAALDEVLDAGLRPGDFADSRHASIFAAITATAMAAGADTSPYGIAVTLDAHKELHRFDGGAAYLHTCVTAVPTAANAGWYAREVARYAQLRAARADAVRLAQVAETGDLEQITATRARLIESWTAAPDRAGKAGLQFLAIADLCAQVDAAGPRRWLLRGLWPTGDYGVHAAEMKAQKTWNTVDLAVSVASGTAWLGTVAVDDPGPVLMFAGEGSPTNLIRRIRAVCAARDLKAEQLPVTICTRAPHLADAGRLLEMAAAVNRVQPKLVTLDPLYLAARGAQASSLYEMGAVLEGPQHLCQEAGAALWVVTHHNRKEGKGAGRITGAGPAEWGRVLVTATVHNRHTDPDTQETTVVTELDVIGGEVADQALRIIRRIRAEDPADLDSALHYTVEQAAGDLDASEPGAMSDMPPARRKLLSALQAHVGVPKEARQLVDWIVEHGGIPLRRETSSRELNQLSRDGLADSIKEPGKPTLWFLSEGV